MNYSNEETLGYGAMLAEQIRESGVAYTALTEFQRFALERGHEFDTETELNAAHERWEKAKCGALISQEEFLAEARATDSELAADTYHRLVKLMEQQCLSASEVYQYARYRWCLSSPDAVLAYMTGPHNFWSVNNCDTEISKDAARLTICEEWGFEASRIRIIGTPYYDATDWNFIRFDCANMAWLMRNGELYQVYQ